MRPIRIVSVAYGPKYQELYRKTQIAISDSVERLFREGYHICIVCYEDFHTFLKTEIRLGYVEKTITFFYPADLFWSKNTLYNLVKLAEGNRYSFAVPHVRVNETFSLDAPMESDVMVNEAFKHAHYTLQTSDISILSNQCHNGLCLRNTGEIMTLQHAMPHIPLVQFEDSDLKFWYKNDIGNWDRSWIDKLSAEGRLRIVGSSDIAFGVELTDSRTHRNKLRDNPTDAYTPLRSATPVCQTTIFSLRGK